MGSLRNLATRSAGFPAAVFSILLVLATILRTTTALGDDAGAPGGHSSDAATAASVTAPDVLPRAPASAETPEAPAATSESAEAPPKAHETDDSQGFDYVRRRFEPAGFPLIGGDSDIGFEFGAVGTFTQFGKGVRPYLWNMDILLAASVKGGPNGLEVTQQNYLWQIDIPRFNGSRVRVNPAVSYERTINQGYFGLGNASAGQKPAFVPGPLGRYFQFDDREARVRELTRFRWHPPFDIMLATTYRYVVPGVYSDTKLASDAAAGIVRGIRPLSIGLVGVGLFYDTRDNEYFPRRGSLHQVGVRFAQGVPFEDKVQYAAFGGMFATYVPVFGPLVLAARGVVDAQFGNVPFYDLYTGGPFQTYEMPGGSAGVRGVPDGRYSGKLKALGNLELRALLVEFHLLGQDFHLGGNALFDAGRLWSDYTFSNPADGTGLGIKWGVGGGAYLQWGQAAVFRVEVAYSPDATSENPTLPLGIYVQDGVMF